MTRALALSVVLLSSTVYAAGGGGGAFAASNGPGHAVSWSVTIEGDGVYGAGVLVKPSSGLVVTCLHVVSEMKQPRVTFSDGTRVFAEVLDTDKLLDLALLRVPPQTREAPTVGEPGDPGDEVFAVGCPRHLAFTLSRGIVSYVNRLIDGVRYLQTDLPINEGNSGGPVVNAHGQWVGVMSFVYRGAQGLSFAVPAHAAIDRFRRWM